MSEMDTGMPKKGMLIAFRIVAVIGAILCGITLAFVVQSLVSDDAAMHRFHNPASAWSYLAFGTVALVAAVRDPAAAVAPFRVWLGLNLAVIAGSIMADDLLSGVLALLIVAALTYALTPVRRAVNRCVKANVALLGLGVAALIPAFAYALTQGDLQKLDPTSSHGTEHHYSGMAIAALSIGLAAIAASFPGTGERLARWLVGVVAVAEGVTALLWSTYLGAWASPWPWIAIAWGIAFIVVAEVMGRKPTAAEAPTVATSSAEVA